MIDAVNARMISMGLNPQTTSVVEMLNFMDYEKAAEEYAETEFGGAF